MGVDLKAPNPNTLVTDEAHSQFCVGVGFNNIYERYQLLWLSGTKK